MCLEAGNQVGLQALAVQPPILERLLQVRHLSHPAHQDGVALLRAPAPPRDSPSPAHLLSFPSFFPGAVLRRIPPPPLLICPLRPPQRVQHALTFILLQSWVIVKGLGKAAPPSRRQGSVGVFPPSVKKWVQHDVQG